MTRRGWAAIILLAWAAALGGLVRRTYFRSAAARLADAALSVPPGQSSYRLAVSGRQVGYTATTVDTTRDTLLVSDEWVLDLPALGALNRGTVRSAARLSRALRLEAVDVTFDGAAGHYTAHARVAGDTVLRLSLVAAGGDSVVSRFSLPTPIVIPSLVPLRLAFGGSGRLQPGRHRDVLVFDPPSLALRDVALDVTSESTLVVPDSAEYDSTARAWVPAHFDTVQGFKIEASSGNERRATWIDSQGRVVSSETATGFTTARTAFEIAYDNFRHRDTTAVIRASVAPPPGAIVPVVRCAAAPAAVIPPPLRLAIASRFLAGEGGLDTVRPSDRSAAPLIEARDSRIQGIAASLRGADPQATATAVARWVEAHVPVAVDSGPPSAVRAITNGRGDCNAVVTAYVALARAAGMAARPVAGLRLVDGRFYYDAWAEVYLGRWTPVDPAARQFPADASHLRVAVDRLARPGDLAPLLGTLKLEAPPP